MENTNTEKGATPEKEKKKPAERWENSFEQWKTNVEKWPWKADKYPLMALLLFFPIWKGISPFFYQLLSAPLYAQWLDKVYQVMNGSFWINLVLHYVCFAGAFYVGKRIWHDNDVRCWRPLSMVLALYVLNDKFLQKATLWDIFRDPTGYRLMFTLCLVVLLGVCLLKIVRQTLKKPVNRSDVKGFSIDSFEEAAITPCMQKYAQNIVRKLLATDTKRESYAFGISGKWGSGKTTFLQLMENEFKGKAEIVHFNPWMCSSPEQLTQDFFAALQHSLKHKYSTLGKPIQEYAQLIAQFALPERVTFLWRNWWAKSGGNLYEKKQQLSDKFSQLPLPVVVMIDDVDRLEREEVFEVLRLIRNTADLRHTIYVVAYDKDYVVQVLEERNIKDAETYLEKIFPVEMCLPNVEKDLLRDVFVKEMMAQNVSIDLIKKILPQARLILRILNTFRRIKRFVRLYILNKTYLEKEFPNELDDQDLFWLELLQYYDRSTYRRLSDNPLDFLNLNNLYYTLKNEKDIQWENNKDKTNEILNSLFGMRYGELNNRINFFNNFSKYFSLCGSPFCLMSNDLSVFLNGDKQAKDMLGEWSKKKIREESILFQMNKCDIYTFKDETLKKYLSLFLYVGVDSIMKENKLKYYYSNMLSKFGIDSPKNQQKENVCKEIISWINDKILYETWDFKIKLSHFVKEVYLFHNSIESDGEIKKIPMIISDEQINDILIKILQTYLAEHSEVSALDVIKKDSDLFKLFIDCCFKTYIKEADFSIRKQYTQIAFDIILNHFSQKTIKPTCIEYEEALKEIYIDDIRHYFGDNHERKDNLEKFKTRCFVPDTEHDAPVIS